MQDNKKYSSKKMTWNLGRMGTNGIMGTELGDEHIVSLLAGFEKSRDNKLARFTLTLIQSQK